MKLEDEILKLLQKDAKAMAALEKLVAGGAIEKVGVSRKKQADHTPSSSHPDYIHQVWGLCIVCGQRYVENTLMGYSTVHRSYIRIRKVDELVNDLANLRVDARRYDVTSCGGCYNYLMSVSKEEIIKILLRLSAKYCWSTMKKPNSNLDTEEDFANLG